MKYWNSPETTSINREPMLNIAHEDLVSLDGQWDFQLLRSFTPKNFDSSI